MHIMSDGRFGEGYGMLGDDIYRVHDDAIRRLLEERARLNRIRLKEEEARRGIPYYSWHDVGDAGRGKYPRADFVWPYSGGDFIERIRGPRHHAVWMDELMSRPGVDYTTDYGVMSHYTIDESGSVYTNTIFGSWIDEDSKRRVRKGIADYESGQVDGRYGLNGLEDGH